MPYKPRPFDGTDLGRYVIAELDAIADEMASAQGAATLFTSVQSAQLTFTTTPQRLEQWTNLTPQRDPRSVVPSLPDGTLYVRRAGVVGVSFTVTALVPAGQEYVLEMYVNGVPTALAASIDASNQTTFATFAAFGTFRVVAGVNVVADAIALYGRMMSGSAAFTMVRGFFSAFWIGD